MLSFRFSSVAELQRLLDLHTEFFKKEALVVKGLFWWKFKFKRVNDQQQNKK